MTAPAATDQKSSATAGGALTAVERITAQAGQLIVFIAAARILGPAEFGLFALVSACAILVLRMSEFGWAQYIMSWHGDSTVPRQVLLIAMVSGAVFAALGSAVGMTLPVFGFSGQTSHLIVLFSIWVMLATTSSAQKGIMIWQDRLKSSAASEITGEVVATAVALAALFSGFGVLSLVFGRLTFQSVHLIVSFSATRLSPKFGLKGAHLRQMLTFSGQLFVSRMIVNIRLYAATFIIGGFLGPASVGYYRAAERLVGAVSEVVFVPTEVLAWSLFRKARDLAGGRLDGFQAQANQFFRVLCALAVPVFIWLTVMGQDVIHIVLGPEWLPALPVVAILAASRAMMLPGLATEAILSLAGQIKRLIPFTLFFLLLTVALTLVAVRFGLYAVAWSQFAVSFGSLLAACWMQQRYGRINWLAVATGLLPIVVPILMGTGVMVFMMSTAFVTDLHPLARIAMVSLASLLVYAADLLAIAPELKSRLPVFLRARPLLKIGV